MVLGHKPPRGAGFPYGALTRSGAPFQDASGPHTPTRGGRRVSHLSCPTTPTQHRTRPISLCRFGLFPFRSPLLRESRLISLPPGTKMVQFPGCASPAYSFQPTMPAHDGRQVSPFGHPWISACLQLPRAFRSSPRPSSPQSAKASTVCSSFP